MGTYTLGEIASRLGAVVRGDTARRVTGLRPLADAGPDDLSFVAHPRYVRAAASCPAALIARPTDRLPGHDLLLVDNPYAALALVMGLFYPAARTAPGISPQAVIGPDVALGCDVAIGPLAVIGAGCALGDRAVVGPGAVLGERVRLGADTLLHPRVVVYAGSVLGARVIVHAGAVIGSDGFGYAETGGARAKIPQVGNVVVEDDVEIGACTTIDRATFGSTIIRRGVKIDNLVQIAHNVVVGEDAVLVAQSGIAGSTRLGRGCILAGQAGVAGHLVLGDGAVVGAKSAALQDLPAGAFVLGHPAIDHALWKRAQAAFARLPDLLRRLARLERAHTGRRVPRDTASRRGKAGRPRPATRR